jgi:hypothetical protein
MGAPAKCESSESPNPYDSTTRKFVAAYSRAQARPLVQNITEPQ